MGKQQYRTSKIKFRPDDPCLLPRREKRARAVDAICALNIQERYGLEPMPVKPLVDHTRRLEAEETMVILPRVRRVLQEPKIYEPVPPGECPVCHHPLRDHAECRGCGALIGVGHKETSVGQFRNYGGICQTCESMWGKREKIARRQLSLDEYRRGLKQVDLAAAERRRKQAKKAGPL